MIKLNLDNCYLHLCSEQQLVDCSTSNYGCNGGWQDAALYDISTISGLDTETSYPYTSGFSGTVNYLLSDTIKRPFNSLISTFLFLIFSLALASISQLTRAPLYPLPNRFLTSKLMTPRRWWVIWQANSWSPLILRSSLLSWATRNLIIPTWKSVVRNYLILFYQFRSGVYVEPNCATNILGYHAITIVGYGTSSTGIDYWVNYF